LIFQSFWRNGKSKTRLGNKLIQGVGIKLKAAAKVDPHKAHT